jgi:hypothetical protein
MRRAEMRKRKREGIIEGRRDDDNKRRCHHSDKY